VTVKSDFAIGHGKEGFRLLFCTLKNEFLDSFGARKTGEDHAAFGIIDPTKDEGFVRIFQELINEQPTPYLLACPFLH